MSKSNAEKYNDCNPRSDSYCMFEQQFKELQNKIEQLGINYAFEDLTELEEQLKEYHTLCKMKVTLEKELKNLIELRSMHYVLCSCSNCKSLEMQIKLLEPIKVQTK